MGATIEDLEKRVKALEGRNAALEQAERDIILAALQWARIVHLGYYLEDGRIVRLLGACEDEYAEYQLGVVKRRAKDLILLRERGADVGL